ncbi:MAG TPA: CHAD domain-containing protein [Thermoanaerobaculia bacterium]|nr:CHAD domain-containing protein [Thermoanaerobaculia bacterium]
MPGENLLWKKKARSLAKASRELRKKSPDGIHDLRVALRRVGATASVLGPRKIAKKSRKLADSLSDLRQIQVDRELLSRVRQLGWLPEEVAFGVDARWGASLREGEKLAARRVPESEIDRLERKLSRLSKKKPDVLPRLEKARRQADENVASPPEGKGARSDRSLHRYRLAVKKARYLTEDLALAGRAGLEAEIEEKKRVQDALGRWNDLRLFRKNLRSARREAERRGTVTYVSELDRLISALEPAVGAARENAVRVAAARRPKSSGRRGRAGTGSLAD